MKFVTRKNRETIASESEPSEREVRTKPVGVASRGGKAAKTSGRKSFTLLIGDEGAILVFMHGSTVLRRLFAASAQPENIGAFEELMKANPGVPVSILADVIDQQYMRHTFPPVSPMSINGLVARRIERDFKPEDMKNALKLWRDEAGRREWQYLIISLANTPHLKQWLDFILELPNQFRGVYLLPVEMQQIMPLLSRVTHQGGALPWQFLISHNKVSGFRQVVLNDGALAFTRVSQAIEDAIPAVIAGNIEQEIISTLEYLRRMNFGDNKTLELMVVCSQEVVDALDLQRFGAGATVAITPLGVAEALGLEQAALSADRFGDVVLVAAFARMRKRKLLFSNAYSKKLSGLYAVRSSINAVAAVLVAAILLMAGSSVMDMNDAGKEAQEVASKKNAIQPQLVAATDAANGLSKDIAYKALVVAANDYYLKDAPLPSAFIAKLAPLLSADMRVKSFQWGPPGAFAAGAATPTVSAPTVPAVNSAGKDVSLLEIHVAIELNGSFASFEDATKFVEKFIVDAKAAIPEYDITADPFPWAASKQTTQEITLDKPAEQASPLTNGQNKITLVFRGPKKRAAVAAGQGTSQAGAK